jgi:hypothetical protein
MIIFYSYIRYYIFDEFSGSLVLKYLLLALITIILLMIIICHTKCVITDPGKIEEFKMREVKFFDYCEKCALKRPLRSHHCKSCEVCILKMDHHCPWIANCVGFKNQKYFYLFLFYSSIGCMISFLGMIHKFLKIQEIIDKYNRSPDESTEDKFKIDIVIDPVLIVVSTTMSIILFIGIFVLFIVHTYYILNNLTSIENMKYKKIEDSPFYNKNKIENFKKVMGQNFFEWWLPIFTVSNKDNGYSFEIYKQISDPRCEHNTLI